MTRWEYAYLVWDYGEGSSLKFSHRKNIDKLPEITSFVKTLRSLGDDGWELVSTPSSPKLSVPPREMAWFKRPMVQ